MANVVNDGSKYVSFDRIKDFLKLSEEELHQAISAGDLRAYRDDDAMKFRLDDVRKFREDKNPKKKKKTKNENKLEKKEKFKEILDQTIVPILDQPKPSVLDQTVVPIPDSDKNSEDKKKLNSKTQEKLKTVEKTDKTQDKLKVITSKNDKTQDKLKVITGKNDKTQDKLKVIAGKNDKTQDKLKVIEKNDTPTTKSEATETKSKEENLRNTKKSLKKIKSVENEEKSKDSEKNRPSRTNDQLSPLDLEEPQEADYDTDFDEEEEYEVDEELQKFLESASDENIGSYAESKAYIPMPVKPPLEEKIGESESPKKEKFMIVGGLLVIVALIIFVNFRSKVFFSEEPLTPVQLGEMKKGDILVVINATGEVYPILKSNVYSKISGTIETITVQEGQKVTKGQPLAYLTAYDLEQEVDRVRNQLAEAKSRYDGAIIALDNAKEECEREKQKLKNEDVNLANQIAQAESDIRTVDYNIKKIEAELSQARKDLENEEELLRQGFGKQQDVEASKQKLEEVKTRLKVKMEESKKTNIQYEELKNKLNQNGESKLSSALNNLKSKENQLETEKIRVEKAEAELKSKEEQLIHKTVRSPIAGVVSEIKISVGDFISQGARGAEPLFVIFDEKEMEIHSLVDEIDIHQIKKDQEATIEIEAIPGGEFRGHVSAVATTASKGQKGSGTSFEVKIKIDKGAERLKPGLSASVGILTQQRKNILKAPQQAVVTKTEAELTGKYNFAENDQAQEEVYKVIFVFQKGVALARKVKTGISDETYVEILDGIELNESIIVGPYRSLDKLKDTEKVVIMSGKEASAEAK